MQGWVTRSAWVSTLAGVANTSGYMLQSLAAADYPDYEARAYHVTLIIFAVLIVEGLMSMYTWSLIPWIQLLAVILHIFLFLIFVVVMLTLAPKHHAEFVFFERASNTGWSNSFISLNPALMTPT